MPGARAIRGSAVTDPIFVLGHRLQQGSGPWHCLGTGSEVLALKNMLLKELIGSRTVFAAVNGDGSVLTADFLPAPDFAGEYGLKLPKVQFLDLVIVVDIDGESIQAHLVFGGPLAERLEASLNFLGSNLARSICQIRGLIL